MSFVLFVINWISILFGVIHMHNKPLNDMSTYEFATFGSGCFWCTEAIFESIEGVQNVLSGYAGGTNPNPDYDQVCSGTTGHAEVVQVTYDPSRVTYEELLEVFWKTHDPTSLNRQGGDVGTQYRSVIFYHNPGQMEITSKLKEALGQSGSWDQPIVTEISPLDNFYKAEDYHQDYFKKNPYQAYCQVIISPKMEKFKKAFHNKLKNN